MTQAGHKIAASVGLYHADVTERRVAFFLITLTAVVSGLFWPLPNHYRATWVASLMDVLHVPLFAALAFALMLLLGSRVVACLLTTSLAGICEVGQLFVGRSPSFGDFSRGFLGVLLAVVLFALFGRPLCWRRTGGCLVGIALILVWPLCSATPVLIDAHLAYQSFPILSDFGSPAEASRWWTESARLQRRASERDSRWTGQVELTPNREGSSNLILFPVVGNWEGFRRLHFEFSFDGEPMSLLLSIRDGRRLGDHERRFALRQRLRAGDHHVSFDLGELAAGGDFAPLDFTQIQSIHLSALELKTPRTLVLHRIYLE